MFLPTLFGQAESLPDELSELVTLTPAQRAWEYLVWQQKPHNSTQRQNHSPNNMWNFKVNTNEQLVDEPKRDLRTLKAENPKSKIESIDASLIPELLRLTQQARDKGASSWVNAIPLKDQGLTLNEQEFRDSLWLRYNLPQQDMPPSCARGEPFNVRHALSFKKGGFVAQRHDGVRNVLTSLLSKVCKNVQVEPHLQPLDNEVMNLRSATTSSDARLDVKAGGFWSRGVTAFFDVRVTHVNSKTNQGKPTTAIFKEQESEKKRKYQQRVLEVEMGSFAPLIFGTNGGMGEECNEAFSGEISREGRWKLPFCY